MTTDKRRGERRSWGLRIRNLLVACVAFAICTARGDGANAAPEPPQLQSSNLLACSSGCTLGGDTCCDPASSLCCAVTTGEQCCGTKCCAGDYTCCGTNNRCAAGVPCCGSTCCPSTRLCCSGTCCVTGYVCLNNTTCCAPDHVADGVCCNTTCTGLCQACVRSKTGQPDGICAAITAGTDPDSECADQGGCGHNGLCDGAGACAFYGTTTLCRASQGDCDPAENCDGAGACPVDRKASMGAGCPSDNNPCTLDQCDGMSNTCQHPAGNAGTPCRPANANDLCAVADTCNGTSATCPDIKRPANYVCRGATDVCDVAEVCDGVTNACPIEGFKPNSTLCRAASCAGGTAILEANCTGSTAACPLVQTQTCPSSSCAGNICAGGCTMDAQCPMDQYCRGGVCSPKISQGSPCSTDSSCSTAHCADGVCCDKACADGVCDICTLTLGTCTAVQPGTVCHPKARPCDIEETCGGATICPPDIDACDGGLDDSGAITDSGTTPGKAGSRTDSAVG